MKEKQMGIPRFLRCRYVGQPHHEKDGPHILRCTLPFWHNWMGNRIHLRSIRNP